VRFVPADPGVQAAAGGITDSYTGATMISRSGVAGEHRSMSFQRIPKHAYATREIPGRGQGRSNRTPVRDRRRVLKAAPILAHPLGGRRLASIKSVHAADYSSTRKFNVRNCHIRKSLSRTVSCTLILTRHRRVGASMRRQSPTVQPAAPNPRWGSLPQIRVVHRTPPLAHRQGCRTHQHVAAKPRGNERTVR
jgi:hypothetical protein